MIGTLLAAALAFGQAPKPAPAPFQVTVSGERGGAMAPVAAAMEKHFAECYPKLVKRFGHPDRPPPRAISLVFERGVKVPAYCQGAKVVVSVEWLTKNPHDIGMLTHELTHAVQAYPPGAPGWLVEGLADYARQEFGPNPQKDWSLPERLTARNRYRDSYRVAARFLAWLEQRTPGVVDKLNRRLQDRTYAVTDFRELAGKPLDALWDECVAALAKPRKG